MVIYIYILLNVNALAQNIPMVCTPFIGDIAVVIKFLPLNFIAAGSHMMVIAQNSKPLSSH